MIEPAVSASAWRTLVVDPDHASERQSDLNLMLADGDAVVQPRHEEIARLGEWSLVFVAGSFRPAVLKRPRAGDFRVQVELGGSETSVAPIVSLARQRECAVDSGASPHSISGAAKSRNGSPRLHAYDER